MKIILKHLGGKWKTGGTVKADHKVSVGNEAGDRFGFDWRRKLIPSEQ